jgi:methionine salvage enolase-phosphatase E1
MLAYNFMGEFIIETQNRRILVLIIYIYNSLHIKYQKKGLNKVLVTQLYHEENSTHFSGYYAVYGTGTKRNKGSGTANSQTAVIRNIASGNI